MPSRIVVAAFVLLSACATAGRVPAARFANRAPVTAVNDRTHVASKPDEERFFALRYRLDVIVYEPLVRFFSANQGGRARNINSVGNVPNSTWFTERGDLTPEQIRRGPGGDSGPVKPWTVVGSKVGGAQLGLRLKDARGDNYLLKFDAKGFPEYETAAAVIVQRLVWALGYNVPHDNIASFRQQDLLIADDATIKDKFGGERPLERAVLVEYLEQIDRQADGSYRGFLSRFLDGAPIGGIAPAGVRGDDPNDRVPHEHRRELRGLGVVYGWLQATDHKLDNSLDIYREDPDIEGRRYVEHYLLDFGNSLGVNGYRKAVPGDGHHHHLDFRWAIIDLFTFGLYRRPWEGQLSPGLPGVGDFDVEHYRPAAFRGRLPYASFKFADRHDGFWAAKRISRLSRPQIEAAVAAGRLTDPRSSQYLVDTLIDRGRKAARYWYGLVSPVDDFEPDGDDGLCFVDLWVSDGLTKGEGGPSRSYELSAYDYSGASTGWSTAVDASASGRLCVRGITAGTAKSGYTIVSIAVRAGSRRLPPAHVHLANSDRGERRVIGVWRE